MDLRAVDLLLSSLDRGESPMLATQALLSAPDEDLLGLACVPRRLNEDVLAQLGAEPHGALARIRHLGLADRVPGRRDEYALANPIRTYHYQRRWSPRPGRPPVAELARLSERLSRYYAGTDEPLEDLYHRFLFDPPGARDMFEQLYEEADESFDLPRCRELLDVLEQRLPELDPSALTLWEEGRAYVNARGLWLDDWYRSVRFLEPQASRAPIEALLAGEPGRSLQLWAAGGLGKTTHIRWLISRRCVPRPARIACARVDFDMIVAAAAVEAPWLVLLELAEQLNAQLSGTPFARLLKQFGEHRERLRLASDSAAGTAPPDSLEADAVYHDEVSSGFQGCLASLGPDERVVVVLDTLEVPLLIGWRPGGRPPLSGLLRDLAEAHAVAPSLRTVFAGRLDLRARVAGFDAMFPGCQTLRLTGFEEAEACRYLSEKRGLRDAGLIRAGARAAGGTPFKLALIADVLDQRPDLTAAEIEEYGEVDLLYLIKRVVERIEDPLTRWVLRYGVIPRALDRTFVEQVMLPFIEEAAARGRDDDRPAHDGLPDRGPEDEQPWLSGVLDPGQKIDADDLWRRLLMYAGGASWVDVEHTAGRETLRFHPDVLDPMRRLLARKEIFPKLHEAAFACFEQRAQANAGQAGRWQTEAVFHRFHVEGAPAAAYWHRLVLEATGPERAERRRRLAGDLLAGDYTDDDHHPRELREGVPLIDRRTLVQARLELAWAITQRARREGVPAASSDWSEASALIHAVTSARNEDAGVVGEDRYRLAVGALALSSGSLDEAAEHVEWVLRSAVDRHDRLWLVREYADALADAGRFEEAEVRYREALDLAGPRSPAGRHVLVGFVRMLTRRDRVGEALVWAQQTLDAAGPVPPADLQILLCDTRLRSGQATLALETSGAIEAHGEDQARLELLRARAALGAGRPSLALRLSGTLLDRLRTESSAVGLLPLVAQATEMGGAARAALLDVEGAMAAFSETAEHWRVAGSIEGVCRCYLRRAEFLAHALGDLRQAEMELAYPEKMRLGAGPDRSRLVLLQAELAGRAGDTHRARGLIESEIYEMHGRGAGPHELVAAALAGLTLEDDRPSAFLGTLCAALASITPAARRLALLRPLRRCRSLLGQPSELRECLRRIVPSPLAGDLPDVRPADAALLAIADADLDRALGRAEVARGKLRGGGALGADGSAAAFREWLEAWRRAGGDMADVIEGGDLARALEAAGDFPLQRAALSILGGSSPGPAAEDLLRRANETLVELRNAGHWHALLQEGLAQAGLRRGDHHFAQEHAQLAASIYERLGDCVARDRVLAGTGALAVPRESGEAVLTITLASGPGPGRVGAELSAGGEILASGAASPSGAVGQALFDEHGEIAQFSPRIAELLAQDQPGLARELAHLLLPSDPDALPFEPSAGGEIRLRIRGLALQTLPWEIGFAHDERLRRLTSAAGPPVRAMLGDRRSSEEVRELQLALNRHRPVAIAADGIHGPESRAALAGFQREAGLPATGDPDAETEHLLLAAFTSRRVTVVRAAAGPEARGHLNLRQTRLPVDWVYRGHGFEVEVIEGLTLSELLPTLAGWEAPLIHISAGFVEYNGTAVLDLAGEWEYVESAPTTGGSERITPSALAHALHVSESRPIVVLDPPAPRSAYELGLQLMLRNGFAGDLFAHGGVRAVLGLGLGRFAAQEELNELVAGSLGQAVALGTLLRRVHQRAARPAGEELDSSAAALFARSGRIRPPWPE